MDLQRRSAKRALRAPSARWQRSIAALALLFFTIANFVAQTHVHLYPTGTRTASEHSFSFDRNPPPGKTDPFDNPATCPICQDIALAGHFTTAAVIAVLPPALVVLPTLDAITIPDRIATISHIWRGRAPPRN